jgi:hypothetical protein
MKILSMLILLFSFVVGCSSSTDSIPDTQGTDIGVDAVSDVSTDDAVVKDAAGDVAIDTTKE